MVPIGTRSPLRTLQSQVRALALALAVALLGVLLVGPGAQAADGTSRLNVGEVLSPNQRLVSPSGQLTLIMQGDGNLVLYAPGGHARWSSQTSGHPGAWAQMNPDGNFVVYGPGAVPLWSSFAEGGGPGAAFVQLQDDGNLVQYTADIAVTWNTGTFYYPAVLSVGGTLRGGQSLQSPNGRYTLNMEPTGNLVLNGPNGQWIWHTNTHHKPVTHLAVQSDGNLVLRTATGGYEWASWSTGHNGGFLQVQDDGNVVYYTPSAGVIWNANAASNVIRPTAPAVPLVNPHPAGTVTSGWTSRASWVAARFVEAFPHYSCDGQAPRTWKPASDHHRGNGIDCTHRPGVDDRVTGDAAAAWLRANAANFKIKYVLWWVDDHYDHIHISVQ